MPKRRSLPLHAGGPLGLAGVTLLASAVGLVVVANDGPDAPRATSGQDQSEHQSPAIRAPIGVERVSPAVIGGAQNRPVAQTDKEGSNASSGAEVSFIVRLKGRPEVDTICRNFKRDRSVAEAAFETLASELPILQDFRLVGASYSGEINLAYQLAAGDAPTRARIEELRQSLLSIDGVAYADPDYVAHPGEDKR